MKGFSAGTLLAAAMILPATACQKEPKTEQVSPQTVYSMDRVMLPEAQLLPALASATTTPRPIASLLNVPLAMRYGDWRWNEDGVGQDEIWILVDLSAQTMSVFRGAHEIGTAVTLYGVDRKPTPTGRFTVLEKRKDHVSNLYNAPMPYMMRLTMDGVAIHGSNVREGAGTHGCLGVPEDFGAKLFQQVKVGTEVLILEDARGAHPRSNNAA